MGQIDYGLQETADLARCHRNTVRNYARRGIIGCYRNVNGYRRFPLEEVLKLKAILEARISVCENEAEGAEA